MSRDIVDTSVVVGGQPCRRRSWSSRPSCSKGAAKARSPATTGCPGTGSTSWCAATTPTGRRPSNRAPGARTTIDTRWVESLAAGLRMEWRHHGIRVGTVHPTFVDTDLVRNAGTDVPTFERLRTILPGALGSTMEAADVASVIVNAVKPRRRRAYAPGSLAAVSAGRSLMLSALG